MNNKELLSNLSSRVGLSSVETEVLLGAFVETVAENLAEGNQVSFLGTGTFEPRLRDQRVSVNPVSKKKLLIPPKVTVAFKPVASLKDKFKNLSKV